jgi:hypothetical protein
MRGLLVLAALGLLGAMAALGTEVLLRLATTQPITLRLPRSHPMKSAIATADATDNTTEIVPAEIIPAPADYPAWLDGFDHQISSLVTLARQGNRVAYNLLSDLNAKYLHTSDQASEVAAIVEHLRTT